MTPTHVEYSIRYIFFK